MTNHCLDCGAEIYPASTRCHSCARRVLWQDEEYRNNRTTDWGQQEVEILKRYYPIGGAELVCQYIQRPVRGISCKANRLGLAFSRVIPRPSREVLYNAYHVRGLSTNGLAREFRVSKGTIYNWMKALHVPTRPFSEANAKNMLGKHHSEETKRKIGLGNKGTVREDLMGRNNPLFRNPKPGGKFRAGTRADIGIFVRSSWEANYARFLKWLKQHGEIVDWAYEPDTFWFEGIKRGTCTYTPDFRITNKDGTIEYHEVKGYWTSKGKTQVKRMAKYHPEVTLKIIDKDAYKALAKDCKNLIPGWE